LSVVDLVNVVKELKNVVKELKIEWIFNTIY